MLEGAYGHGILQGEQQHPNQAKRQSDQLLDVQELAVEQARAQRADQDSGHQDHQHGAGQLQLGVHQRFLVADGPQAVHQTGGDPHDQGLLREARGITPPERQEHQQTDDAGHEAALCPVPSRGTHEEGEGAKEETSQTGQKHQILRGKLKKEAAPFSCLPSVLSIQIAAGAYSQPNFQAAL